MKNIFTKSTGFLLLLLLLGFQLNAQIKFETHFTGYKLINEKGETTVKYIEKIGPWKNGRCKLIIKPFATRKTEYAFVNEQGDIIGIKSSIDFDLEKAPCLVQKEDEKNSRKILNAVIDKDGNLLTEWYSMLESAENGYYWFGEQYKRLSDTIKTYKGLLTLNKKLFEVTAGYTDKGFLNSDIAVIYSYKNFYFYHIPTNKALQCENYLIPTPNGYIVEIYSLFGLVDKKLQLVHTPKFESLSYIQGSSGYFKASKGRKWGILNQDFKEVHPFEFTELIQVSDKWLFKKSNTEWGIISKDFKLIHEATADEIYFDTLNKYVIIRIGKYFGAVNLDGLTIVPIQYEELSHSYGVLVGRKKRKFDVYGKSGKLLLETVDKSKNKIPQLKIYAHIDNFIWIHTFPNKRGDIDKELWIDSDNEKLYYIDSKEIATINSIEHKYSKKASTSILSLGYTRNDTLYYQYLDLGKGRFLGPEFSGISFTETITYWTQNAYKKDKVPLAAAIVLVPALVIGISNAYNRATAGYTSHSKEKTSWVFWGSAFNDGYALISKHDLFGYMDLNGDIVIAPKYFNATVFSEGLAAVIADTSTALWSVIDKEGQEVLPAKYQELGMFSDGLCPARIDGKAFYIDKKGNTSFDNYNFEAVQSFSEGIAAVKQNGKWGYIDISGKWLAKPQFDEASSFINGQGKMKVIIKSAFGYSDSFKIGYVNKKGEVIFPNRY